MRIFSKKSLQFDDPAGEQPAVVVQHQAFADVPDWVVKSAMFKFASADEDVEVINSRQDEIAVETGGKTAAAKAKVEAKAKADAAAAATKAVTQFTTLTEDEQKAILQEQTIEPGSTPEERVQQYTGLLQKQDASNQQ